MRIQELKAAREVSMRSEELAMMVRLSGGVADDRRNPLGTKKPAAYLANRKISRERSAEEDGNISELLDLFDPDNLEKKSD